MGEQFCFIISSMCQVIKDFVQNLGLMIFISIECVLNCTTKDASPYAQFGEIKQYDCQWN